MLAQRVPPSACSTSQSMCSVRSPSFFRSTTARRLRPIRRWISWVRPDCLPRAASRSVRVWVERGSMPYSAVTQPSPLPFLCGGSLSRTLAVHSTRVSPMETRTEPSACLVNWRGKLSGRSASGTRPLGRAIRLDMAAGQNGKGDFSAPRLLGAYYLASTDTPGLPAPAIRLLLGDFLDGLLDFGDGALDFIVRHGCRAGYRAQCVELGGDAASRHGEGGNGVLARHARLAPGHGDQAEVVAMLTAAKLGMVHQVAHRILQRVGVQQGRGLGDADHAPDAVSAQQQRVGVVQRDRRAAFHLRRHIAAQTVGHLVALRVSDGLFLADNAIAHQLGDGSVVLGSRNQAAATAEQVQSRIPYVRPVRRGVLNHGGKAGGMGNLN